MELKTNEEILSLSRSVGFFPIEGLEERRLELLKKGLSPAVKDINESIVSSMGLKFKDLPEERRRLLILV